LPLIRNLQKLLVVWLLLGLPLANVWAEHGEIVLLALTTGKAIVLVDNQRLVLRTGEPAQQGLVLINANSKRAIIEVDGRKQRFEPNMVTRPVQIENRVATEKVRESLWADVSGFFIADGSINGQSVKFLIDTGSNHVALSSRLARQLGLDLSNGTKGIASTASGRIPMTLITLDSVAIGRIRLSYVKAAVLRGDFPEIPLLGASFLGRLQMLRSGDRMELIQQ